MMKKKIGLSLLLFFLAGMSLLPVLPQAETVGRKACRAANILLDRAYAAVVPLPELDVGGNGHIGYTGEGQGAKRVPVLMYHYVIPQAYNREPGNRSIINLEAFEQGMDYLYQEGYYTASLSELEDYVHGRIRLPEKTVVITFDDGYENNYIYAYPLLKKYGFRAAVFIIGERVQEQTTKQFDLNTSTYFSKEQMEASKDVFEFHSHTYQLHNKTVPHCGELYASTRDLAKLQEDIVRMKRFGIDTPYFAYPYGDRNDAMARKLVENGYRMAFTVKQGFVEPGDAPMYLNRLTVTSDTDLSVLLEE
jgi:peptidoglycan/xylan/chitin deacetylase (PgdA/CDA1 family)